MHLKNNYSMAQDVRLYKYSRTLGDLNFVLHRLGYSPYPLIHLFVDFVLTRVELADITMVRIHRYVLLLFHV